MAKRSGVTLTKRVVDAAEKKDQRYHVWDDELTGFALRIEPSGVKTFVIKYRAEGGGRSAKQRWLVIGRFGPLTPDQARKIAKAKLGSVAAGADPANELQAKRRELTMTALIDLYEKDGCVIQRGKRQGEPMKPTTKAYTLARLRHHVVPLLGTRRAPEINPGDIERFVADVTSGKTAKDEKVGPRKRIIVVRGLSQSRLRRLAALCRDSGPFEPLPEGWLRVLPTDAPLSTPSAWDRLFARLTPEDWPDGTDHAPALRAAVETLTKGPDAASEVGEAFLKGRAFAIWRKALLAGPAASIDATLETLKQDDGLEACVSVAWMPASALAASPRRFVRLLGLNSSRWPRGIAEDRLIPDHIIPTPVLDPLPVNLADRRDCETILATTADNVVLSRARRDSDGRLLGRSPLLAGRGDEAYLRRNATPAHAFSETDRLMARPEEFAADPQAVGAQGCWRDWRQAEITPHDGLVRANHPLVLAILGRTQSASSLPSCCAIRSASCGSMRSDGVNRRAAPNRSCSTRSGSAISSIWFWTAPCATSKPQAGLHPPTRSASKRRWLGPCKPSPPIGKASVQFRRPSFGGAPSTTPA
jgi:hypothetical protein